MRAAARYSRTHVLRSAAHTALPFVRLAGLRWASDAKPPPPVRPTVETSQPPSQAGTPLPMTEQADPAAPVVTKEMLEALQLAMLKKPGAYLNYNEFAELCTSLGLPPTASLAQLVQRSKLQGVETRMKLVTRPAEVLAALDEMLSISQITKQRTDLAVVLPPLQAELAQLEALQAKLDAKAVTAPRWYANVGLLFVLGQWYFLFRCVFFTFDWNLMEPITYFISYTSIMGGIWFYLFTKREYDFASITEMLREKKKARLYRRNNFTPQMVEAVKAEIATVQRALEALQIDPPMETATQESTSNAK